MDELRVVLGQLGMSTDRPMVQAMLDIADTDGDGQLDYDEFIEFISVGPSLLLLLLPWNRGSRLSRRRLPPTLLMCHRAAGRPERRA